MNYKRQEKGIPGQVVQIDVCRTRDSKGLFILSRVRFLADTKKLSGIYSVNTYPICDSPL